MSRVSHRKRDEGDPKPSAFENVRSQIGYCGLWCGSCSIGNGSLNDLARGCSKTITDYGVHEWGPKEIEFEGLLKGLAGIRSMRPCAGCLQGGGREDCVIRACAIARGVAECVDCDVQASCKNMNIILHMRTGAKRVGMKVKDKGGSRTAKVKAWESEDDKTSRNRPRAGVLTNKP
jgi:hypothetical protein